jgi:hypothetical protein
MRTISSENAMTGIPLKQPIYVGKLHSFGNSILNSVL